MSKTYPITLKGADEQEKVVQAHMVGAHLAVHRSWSGGDTWAITVKHLGLAVRSGYSGYLKANDFALRISSLDWSGTAAQIMKRHKKLISELFTEYPVS